MDLCTICDKPLHNKIDQIIIMKERGLNTLINSSKSKNDNKWKQWNGKTSFSFHTNCSKRYPISKKARISSTEELARPSTSSTGSISTYSNSPPLNTDNKFNFSELCFFCAKSWDIKHKPGRLVKQNYIKERLLSIAEQRGDILGASVTQRLYGISGLVDVKARYHLKCYTQFITIVREKNSPFVNPELMAAIDNAYKHIENSGNSRFLLSELRQVMGEYVPTNKTIYSKLKEKYGDDIYISHSEGKETVIYYKNYDVSKICSDWLCDENSLGEAEKKTILKVAAGILNKTIKTAEYETDSYPAPANFLDRVIDDIPPLLTIFLDDLILSGKTDADDCNFVKRDNIAHAIVSAIRPKSFISNLQLAVGTYIYRKSGSKLIIDLLTKLGVCASYYSIQLHEASTMIDPPKMNVADVHVQYVFDNTDHNVSTLDGHRTFHCLGGIAVYTPENEITYEGRPKKCKVMPPASTLASCNTIETVPYGNFNQNGLKKIEFVNTSTLLLGESAPLSPSYSTYLWAKCFAVPKLPTWKGFMEVLSNNSAYFVSRVVCLPFINEPPSKLTTLSTALHYAVAETKKLNQEICFITFDQPLYLKARNIVVVLQDRDLKNVVVRLGGFHLLMSYLGAIGNVMDGSLEDLWSVVYAPESVKKMMAGHAFSRSLRAHILTFTALDMKICNSAEQDSREEYQQFIHSFLSNWTSEPPQMSDCQAEPMITQLTVEFVEQLNILKNNGPTSQLWIQYFESVIIALQFIEAERLGNWKLHLQSINKMLPLFHASGHFAYAKSAQIYLQNMAKLEIVMNDNEYRKFTQDGCFTIRRSDKPWSGIWSDMTIEQTLNRFFGTDLKHDRGVTPSVVARYLSTMPSSFSVMEGLEIYCGVNSATSEQHVDLSDSRMKKDDEGITQLLFWLNAHDPFQPRSCLMSLSTGIIGGSNINCHLAIEKGQNGMLSMVGKNADNVSISMAFKVKSLAAARSGIHLDDGNFASINSTLLFQRISVAFQGNETLTRDAFQYELSPYPLSLFDENRFMRKTQKSELYKVFTPHLQSESFLQTFTFVIDGGFLLHQVVWPHGKTYKDICHIYLNYIKKCYRQNAWVVFDGYDNEYIGVKSYERYRRREKNMAADVDFHGDMLVTLTQAKFLSNTSNKQKFVKFLSKYLHQAGIQVKEADEDADTLIVTTAIALNTTTSGPVAVIGNDVDLFVLLIALTPDTDTMYFYKISPVRKTNTLYSTSFHKHLKPFILFAHAFSGCDSTSAIYCKGKKSIITLLEKKEDLRQLTQVFYNSQSSHENIQTAAERFVHHLYGNDQQQQSIVELRYKRFVSLAAHEKTEVCLAQLPPTPSALYQHAQRVYFQIQLWLGNILQAENWGWRKTKTLMLPIMSTEDPAPKNLLAMVFCGCTGTCDNSRCRCKTAGLQCTFVCKNCNGLTCSNASPQITLTEDLEEETDIQQNDHHDDSADNSYILNESMSDEFAMEVDSSNI